MDRIGVVAITGLATGLAAADSSAPAVMPDVAPRGTVESRHVAHIYYNVATGEKVAMLIDDARPADDVVSQPVWISSNMIPCASFGQNSGNSGVLDDPDCTQCSDSTRTGVVFLDWGDIEFDSVVDCVGVAWVSGVKDDDLDGDGVGDGVEGFAGTWAWYDRDDGFNSSDVVRLPVAGFTLTNLPGDFYAPGRYIAPMYTATIDLEGDFSSSMAFELGDTDGFSAAPNFYPFGGADLDSDGRSDFAYTLVFTQPGTYDFDNADGDDDPTTGVDGDHDDAGFTAWPLGAGFGDISTDGSTYIPETSAPGAIGIEDAFDFFADIGSDGSLDHIGTFWYGGFHCDIDGDGDFDHSGFNSNPYTQFYIALYTPTVIIDTCGDLAPPFGVLNFFDVAEFISLYNAGDLSVDFAAPYGTLDFFDISAYITMYNAGCP